MFPAASASVSLAVAAPAATAVGMATRSVCHARRELTRRPAERLAVADEARVRRQLLAGVDGEDERRGALRRLVTFAERRLAETFVSLAAPPGVRGDAA